jgi:hypothetical protein
MWHVFGGIMKQIITTIAFLTLAFSNIAQAQNEVMTYAKLEVETISKNMNVLSPKLLLSKSAQIRFSDKFAELSIERRMPSCAPGMMCIQVMPAPIKITLPITQVVKNQCYTKYIATSLAKNNTDSKEELVIYDYTNSVCEMYLKAIGTVTYSVTGRPAWSEIYDTATATFLVKEFVQSQQ